MEEISWVVLPNPGAGHKKTYGASLLMVSEFGRATCKEHPKEACLRQSSQLSM